MSLSDRRTFLAGLGLLGLGACGFQPVLKAGGAARGLRGQIRFNLIESRAGFVLLEKLEKAFGDGGLNARFQAKTELNFEEQELVLIAATSLTRVTLFGGVKVAITDTTKDAIVFEDKIRDVVSFTTSAETAVTIASQQDAKDRLVGVLAERLILQLNATAESWAG